MSRIDDALKRVASDGSESRVAFAPGDRPARRDDHVLEHYPTELEPSIEGNAAARQYRTPISIEPARVARAISTFAEVARTIASGSCERGDRAVEKRLVVTAGDGVFVEQYRRLAAAIHQLQIERGLKTMMVTSALPKEGKTLTVANLALTLSRSYGRKVLLIDADLRRPTIHEVLSLPNVSGLHEALSAPRSNLPIVRVSPELHVLTAGRPDNNPLAALTSERMQQLLEEAADSYDWVLLDAPPVGIMPDAGLLAGITGATLVVIAAGSTPYHLVARVVAEVGRERIIGTVLNRIADENIPAKGYYQHYYSQTSTTLDAGSDS